jgi:hypothetical protein
MKEVFYFLLVLGFTQSFCYSSGMTYAAPKGSAYIINDISESLQNNITLFDAEDFELDFDSFCYVNNLIIYLPYSDITSHCEVNSIIYLRHLNLVFISDIPPPC